MTAVIAGAVVVTVLVLMVAAILINRPEGRHAAPRPPKRRPQFTWPRQLAAKVNGLRRDELSDEDRETELWVDGLVRKPLGPAAPARRPQVLTAARVRAAAIIRAIPLDQLPWLQHGHGYTDTTGSFEAITAEPPALHAHESIAMTQAAMAEGLAEQQAKEWGP